MIKIRCEVDCPNCGPVTIIPDVFENGDPSGGVCIKCLCRLRFQGVYLKSFKPGGPGITYGEQPTAEIKIIPDWCEREDNKK